MSLGAALYVPASRQDLGSIVRGQKLPGVRTIIVCTEDAILEHELRPALRNLEMALADFPMAVGRRTFVRTRSPEVLQRILAMKGAECLDGFVLPKARLESLRHYFVLLANTRYRVMPVLETREVFEQKKMTALLRFMTRQEIRQRILLLRIGGNDLLSLIGIRRPIGKTIYQTPIGQVITQLVTTFRPYGFDLSGPVFEYLNDPSTLRKEVEEDLAHGLVGKTAIHPAQVRQIEQAYRVCVSDVDDARTILSEGAPAVFRYHDAMFEPSTHRNWALKVLSAADCFGIGDSSLTVDRQ